MVTKEERRSEERDRCMMKYETLDLKLQGTNTNVDCFCLIAWVTVVFFSSSMELAVTDGKTHWHGPNRTTLDDEGVTRR